MSSTRWEDEPLDVYGMPDDFMIQEELSQATSEAASTDKTANKDQSNN